MGLDIKKNRKGQYNMKSTISGEQVHEEKWISEKEAFKELILRQWFNFVEESIKIYMEFPSGYHVNGERKIIKEKHCIGGRWIIDNWNDDEAINKKFGEICKELDIVIDTTD